MPICWTYPLAAVATMAMVAIGATPVVETAPGLGDGGPEPALSSSVAASGAGNATSSSPVVTFTSPGTKTVTLKVCNSAGCSTVTRTVSVLDPVPRITSLSGPSTVGTSEGPVTFSAVAAGRPPLNSQWTLTLPDGSRRTAISPAFVWAPDQVGSYQVALTVSNLWGSKTASLPVSVLPSVFADVPPGLWAASEIEALYFAGLTTGCSADAAGRRLFCPGSPVNRAELAAFLGRALHPTPFVPPTASGLFGDVPASFWAAPWIEQIYRDGLTTGCGVSGSARLYCPQSLATRAEIAVLLVRAVHGSGFVPPPAVGLFSDVPVFFWAASWIEQLYRDGITAGCQASPARLFCPGQTTTRAEVAVFLVRAFHLVERPVPLVFAARLCSAGVCSYPAGMPIEFGVQVGGGIPGSYEYDWNGDGSYEESTVFPVSHVYAAPGRYTPRLRLRLGSWTAVIAHPYPIEVNAVTAAPLPPTALSVAVAGSFRPAATDPPGTPVRVGYSLGAADPSGLRGYAAFVNDGGTYRFAGLLATPRTTAGDLLLLPGAPPGIPGVARFLSVRAFSATGYGPSSVPVRLP